MGCSGSHKEYVNSYKYMITDSDIKNIEDENNSFFYLIMTKSLPNFIEIIEESKILEHKNNSTNDSISKYEKILKMLFNGYILEENIKIYDGYNICNIIANTKNNSDNEFILVTLDFLYLIDLQDKYLNYVLIKFDKDKKKNYIYFSKDDEFLYFKSKRKGIYEFIIQDNNNSKTSSYQNSGNNNIINNRSKHSKDYEKINVIRKNNQHKNNSKYQYEPTEFEIKNYKETINHNDSVVIKELYKQNSGLNNYSDKSHMYNKEQSNNNNGYNVFNNNKSIKKINSNIISNKDIYNYNNI